MNIASKKLTRDSNFLALISMTCTPIVGFSFPIRTLSQIQRTCNYARFQLYIINYQYMRKRCKFLDVSPTTISSLGSVLIFKAASK